VTATVGIDGVAAAFADLANPERHTKIIVEPVALDVLKRCRSSVRPRASALP